MAEITGRLKRILLLDRFFFPDEQATSVYLTELTTALKDRFHFQILCGPPLVVTDTNTSVPPPAQVLQVPAFRLSKRFLLSRFLNDLSFILAALFRGLFVQKPDLVVSQTSPPGIWWIGFLLSRWHRRPWIQVFQDIFPDNLKALSSLRIGFLFTLLDRVSSAPLRKADRMVVVGEDMKKRLAQKGFHPEKITTIPNWADLDFIKPLSRRNSYSEKRQLADKFAVLYAGNFGRVHNFEDLLDAAGELRREPQIAFLLVGEGARRGELIRQIQCRGLTNVKIAPFEPRSKLPEVLAAADLSVILLRKGMAGLSVPSKIYSLLASGRPILACVEEESDIARLVREAEAGVVVPPGDGEGFARAVKELFQKPELREKFGANARRFAEAKNFQRQAFQGYERTFNEKML